MWKVDILLNKIRKFRIVIKTWQSIGPSSHRETLWNDWGKILKHSRLIDSTWRWKEWTNTQCKPDMGRNSHSLTVGHNKISKALFQICRKKMLWNSILYLKIPLTVCLSFDLPLPLFFSSDTVAFQSNYKQKWFGIL